MPVDMDDHIEVLHLYLERILQPYQLLNSAGKLVYLMLIVLIRLAFSPQIARFLDT